MSKKRKHKQKQKKYNPLKMIKKLAREIFMDMPTETRVHKVKKKYSRKVKHKKRYTDEN